MNSVVFCLEGIFETYWTREEIMAPSNIQIGANLFAVNRAHIQGQIDLIADKVDRFHVDLMDGILVPTFCGSQQMLQDINFHGRPVEVHLTMNQPESFVTRLLDHPFDILTIEISFLSPANIIGALKEAKEAGKQVGVSSFFLAKQVESLPFLKFWLASTGNILDHITLMMVEDQNHLAPFKTKRLKAISEMVRYRDEEGLQFKIGAEGHVTRRWAPKMVTAGAEFLISGSYIFRTTSLGPEKAVQNLRAVI